LEVRLSTSKSRGPLQLYSDFPLVEEKRVPFCFPVLVLHHLSFLRLFISSTRFPNETCPLTVQGLVEGRYTTNSSASSTSSKSLSSYASLSSSPLICANTGSPRSHIPFGTLLLLLRRHFFIPRCCLLLPRAPPLRLLILFCIFGCSGGEGILQHGGRSRGGCAGMW
jgi:hypothetical protein